MSTLIVTDGIASDKAVVETILVNLLPHDPGLVAQAMRYATLGEAQRLRPILTVRIARAIEQDEERVLCAAAALELLHCASLIVDDLPCMDNSPTRRNRDAVHVRFGEATAILAAFGLVALAARSAADQICFQTKLLRSLSCDSLIGGQALDLALAGVERTSQSERIAYLKTVPLFILAAEAACSSPSVDPIVKNAAVEFARQFGMSYQLVDDYLDGETRDIARVSRQLTRTRRCLDDLSSNSAELHELLSYLDEKFVPGQAAVTQCT